MTNQRRGTAAIVLVTVLLLSAVAGGGCVPKEGTAEKPAIVKAWVNIIDPSRASPSVSLDVPGSQSLFVSTGPVDFYVELGVAPGEVWFGQNAKAEGATPSQSSLRDRQITYSFPEGPVGEKITITVSSVVPPDNKKGNSLVVTLERAESTSAKLEIERDGDWSEVQSGDIVQGRPLRLRLGFTQAMDEATVGSALATTGLGTLADWTSDGSATITLAEPPSLIEVNLVGVRDARGLPLKNRAIWEIYVGQPPRLYSMDPGFSGEQPICDLMADVCAAAVNPDGRSLLVEAFKNRTGHIGVWLVDLTAGDRRTLEGAYYPGWVGLSSLLRFDWTGESIGYEVVTTAGLLLHKGVLPRDLDHYSLSPDGKCLAGLVAKPAESGESDLVWNDLAVTDLSTGVTRLFEDFVLVYAPPDAPMILGAPAWSKDSSRIAAVSDQASGSLIRVLELSTAQVLTEVPLAGLQNGSWSFFSWSPDGRWWIAGESIMETNPPYSVRDLVVAGQGRPNWSGKGSWFSRSEAFDGWGEIKLYRIDSILGPVVEQSLGEAFPCGWDKGGKFHFIRWSGSADRFLPVW